MPSDRKTNGDVEVVAKSPLVPEFMHRIIGEETDALTGHVFPENLARRAAEAFELFEDDGIVFAHALIEVAREVIAANGGRTRRRP